MAVHALSYRICAGLLLLATASAEAQDADELFDAAEQAFAAERYEAALDMFAASAAAARGARRLTVAQVMALRGSSLAKSENLFIAERYIERGLDALTDQRGISRAEIMTLLASVQESLGRTREAAESSEAALRLAMPIEGTDNCETYVRALSARVGHLLRRREYAAVEADVGTIRRSDCGTSFMNVYRLQAALALGAAYRQQGSYATAEAAYLEVQRALRPLLQAHSNVSQELHQAYVSLDADISRVMGELYLYSGSGVAAARALLERALELHTQLNEPLEAAITRGHLAEAKHLSGRYVEAIDDYVVLRKFFEEYGYADGMARMAYHEGRALSAATSQQLRALAVPVSNRDAEAIARFETAIEKYAALDDPEWVWRAQFARARQLERIGAPLEDIERTYAAAIEVFDTITDSVAGGDQYKDRFGETYRRLYEARISLELQRSEPNWSLVESLAASSRSRAIRQSILAGLENPECRELIEQIALEHRTLAEVGSGLRVGGAAAPPARREVDSQALVRVSYFAAPAGITARVVDAMGNVIVRPCDSTRTCMTEAQLAESVALLVSELQAVAPMSRDSRALAASHALYDALIAPIDDVLTTETVRIVPSGLLELVPFAALARRDASGDPVYLLTDHRIEIASIPAQRVPPRQLSRDAQSVGWIVAPRTHNPELEAQSEAERSLASALDLAQSFSPRFPGSAIYTDTEATKDALKSALAGFDVVHVGAHAELAASTSYIQLAPRGPPGQLTPCEIMSHRGEVRSRLVVLAACNSVVASVQGEFGGEHRLASLGMAFAALGVANVVGTLWEVSAEITSRELMARFYEGLDARLDVTEALTNAQRELMVSERYGHPYYWAGFVTLVADDP